MPEQKSLLVLPPPHPTSPDILPETPPAPAAASSVESPLIETVPTTKPPLSRTNAHVVGEKSGIEEKSFGETFLRETFQQNLVIDHLSIGLILVDDQQKIVWANRHFLDWLANPLPATSDFYAALGNLVIEGPDFCPLHTVRSTQCRTQTTVRIGEEYFEFHVSVYADPLSEAGSGCLVEMRDVTDITRVDQTLKKLLVVGRELADLSGEELATMSVEARHQLLTGKIERSMREILQYDVVEFRLLDKPTGRLDPFLAFGMPPEATQRPLFAATSDNGITGFVAATGDSVLCEETIDHPLYFSGAIDARSALTVPLLWHDMVIGTCNVESRSPRAFSDRDKYFLQLFARDVAAAIHTLERLSQEKQVGALSSLEAVIGYVSPSIDQILQESSFLLDEYGARRPDAGELLRKILEHARNIKDQIGQVRQQLVPRPNHPDAQRPERPLLARRRILVIDKDEEVLRNAHRHLEKYDCIVETAPDALIALRMIRVSHYDAILCEIKPDGGMSGYQLMLRIFELRPEITVAPLLLMTGFGYDPGHTIVSAKAKGLLGVLYKPFIPKQLVTMLENVITVCGRRDADGNLLPPDTVALLPSTMTPPPSHAVQEFSAEPNPPGTSLRESGTPPIKSRGTFCQRQSNDRLQLWKNQVLPRSPGESESPGTPPETDFDAT